MHNNWNCILIEIKELQIEDMVINKLKTEDVEIKIEIEDLKIKEIKTEDIVVKKIEKNSDKK